MPNSAASQPLFLYSTTVSDVGTVRANNQDSSFAGEHLIAICDGMGGHAGGDTASSIAIRSLAHIEQDDTGGDVEVISRMMETSVMAAHDAIVGDMERGTKLLLLSYPVARWQVLLGKFLGHLAVLAFATCLGYGAAAAALPITGSSFDSEGLAAFAAMIGSSILLGAVFVAIGYLVSAVVRDRGTAAGLCIGLWLALVLIYDMALLGLLVLDQGRNISGGMLNALLLLNPTDAYRLFNLTGFANVSLFSGMAGLAGSSTLSVQALLTALVLWILVPLAGAALAFSRREL